MSKYQVICGDMRLVLPTVPPASVDAIVTDPPYGLEFMGKGWDIKVPGPEYWRECLRVAKPGAHLVAFGGTRTAHRLACAIEDAGWEIRDCLSWLYGSGFPKSHDVSKAIDKEAGAERTIIGRNPHARPIDGNGSGYSGPTGHDPYITSPATPAAAQWQGWGTALKPAWEPIYLARKPLVGTVASNVLEYGCGGLNVDGCRIGTEQRTNAPAGNTLDGTTAYHMALPGRGMPNTAGPSQVEGRWPANLCLDESAAAMLDEQTGVLKSGALKPYKERHESATSYKMERDKTYDAPANEGGASRFFYVAKASRAEREAGLNGNGARANTHPTVKPVSLMRWLVRLVTPPGGIVLDPFAGSGSTGIAALQEGTRFLGIELLPEFVTIAEARIAHHGPTSPSPHSPPGHSPNPGGVRAPVPGAQEGGGRGQ